MTWTAGAPVLVKSCAVRAFTAVAMAAGALLAAPAAHGDNKRLNDGVVANVYTVQHQAGCTNDVTINPQLQLAAEWHTRDVLNNPALDGGVGSDGSSPQDRANAAGYRGQVAETVAINPAMSITGRNSQILWIEGRQATSDTGVSGDGSGVMSTGRSRSLPWWNTAPARTNATRCGALTARHRDCAASISL